VRGPPPPAIIALLTVLACSSSERDSIERAALPPGVVARVGTTDIAATTVASIAQAQRISPVVATERAINDALLASAAQARRDEASVAARSAHSRALVEALQIAAAEAGPVTDEEIAKLTAERWTELDRPVAVRTTHVVALVKKPDDDAPARAFAERMARELEGIREPAAFIERAKALGKEAAGGVEFTAERLPPIVTDGRSFDPDRPQEQGTFDQDYTRAAHALAEAGAHSPVVKTRFGYHVILLEERIAEQRVSLEERRSKLGPVAIARRAQRELGKLITSLRGNTPVEVSRAVEELTARVGVAP
jgi:peptidyl-prolyl cis-trans isomerase C